MVVTYTRIIRPRDWVYPGQKYTVVDTLSRFPINGNQETKHESKYLVETMSKLFNINGITEGKFPLSFQTIDCYQQEYPILTKKLKRA